MQENIRRSISKSIFRNKNRYTVYKKEEKIKIENNSEILDEFELKANK